MPKVLVPRLLDSADLLAEVFGSDADCSASSL